MGRLDVPDKDRDFTGVTFGYLDELYTEIEALKARCDALEVDKATLLSALADARMKKKPSPPVYRRKLPW